MLSKLSKFLLYTLDLGGGFEVMKSSRITKLDRVVRDWMRNVIRQGSEFKTIEKKLLIRFFHLSVTLVGCRTNGIKKYEHIVS